MKAYIRLKINNINITYEKLGKQIWGVPGKNPWFNHFGDGKSFRKELDIGLGILPTDFNEKWKDTHKGWGPVMINVKKCRIDRNYWSSLISLKNYRIIKRRFTT